MRILVVEDEMRLASFLKRGLEAEHYAVDVATDGEDGLHLATTEEYDLVLLDVMLPKVNGFEILQQMRTHEIATPVIVLTARGELGDRVRGLDLGADDYLTKPFAFEELIARVRALLRRGSDRASPFVRVGPILLDPVTRTVTVGNTKIEFTPKEFALLEYIMRNEGTVLTRAMIAQHVWDLNYDSYTNLIDVFVNHLRRKLEPHGCDSMIHTVRGVGYVLKNT
jgi:heavy metal response regulator